VTGRSSNVVANESNGRAVALPATTTVEDLVKALNMIGVGPRDLVAVLQAMKAAGAIDADLEVM
jgi:flagellar P-ring protein precursor FlgI